MSEAPTQDRLSVNLSPDVADALRAYVRQHGVTVTEAIRRAIRLLAFVEDAGQQGKKVLIEDRGQIHELVFFGNRSRWKETR